MPKAAWVQNNFNGGEWSPLAYGRSDLAKYHNSLATCLNFIPTQQGGLTRRPGTVHVAEVKDSTGGIPRLQRFEFSMTQAYILEFGHQYIRFYVDYGQLQVSGVPTWDYSTQYQIGDLVSYLGVNYFSRAQQLHVTPTDGIQWRALTGTIFEVPTVYTIDEVWGLNFAQSADTLYITHADHPVSKLQRLGATQWRLVYVNFLDGPYLPFNLTSTTLTPAGTTGTVAVVASSATGINNDNGFRLTDIGRSLRIKCGGVWLWGIVTTCTDATHITWTISDPNGEQIPKTATAVANLSGGSVFSVSIVDGGSGYGDRPPAVSFSGGGGSGAIAYAVLTDGTVTSIIVSVTGSGYSSTPLVALTPPTAIVVSTTSFWNLGLWNSIDGYPTSVQFHQDRLCFAGSAQYPGRVDGSNTGDYENFAPTNVDGTVVDSNAMSFTLNSNSVNAVTWLVSDENGLLVGTAGGEWVISPSSSQQAVTPTNVNVRPLSNFGSVPVQPIRISKATLFVQRTGRKLREMFYQFAYNTFQAVDVSLVGEHLTKSGLRQMALQLAPQQIIWITRNDGSQVAVTYDKDQDICGWHQHTFGGSNVYVESCANIPSPDVTRDDTWFIVRRSINGQTKRYVEYLSKSWEDGDVIDTSCFLDSFSNITSLSNITTVTGLSHLEGQTVGVLTDGAVHPDCVVTAGQITLQWGAKEVGVGLRYTSRAKTLRIETQGQDGTSQGKFKKIYRTVFRFFQSVGLSVNSDDPAVNIYPETFRSASDDMSARVPLFDGDKRWSHEGSYTLEGQVQFETSDPLPCNITMLMAQLDTQDGI